MCGGETTATQRELYFPRQLTYISSGNNIERVDEAGMLAMAGPKIILGEPGMGKSVLLTEVGRRLETEVVSAVRFLSHLNPDKLVAPKKPLVIDGLDEAIARRENDAVDQILARLEAVGSPLFILSCRSREWQTRTILSLRQIYGIEATVLSIEPFTQDEARSFLSARHPKADAEHIFDQLSRNHIEELYRNPLTLNLIGRVAEHDGGVPATRAKLFHRVCQITWPEHEARRQDTGLGQINEHQALDAAGAISAALLFAGAEAATLAGQSQVQDCDIRLADIQRLPGGQLARQVFSSKLFVSVGPDRAKPIHRVVAEYLAARWLARQAQSPRSQRRILAQFHGAAAVPASLRGLHAWLAYHRPTIAEAIIDIDPYGVLRYGETSEFPPSLARHLLRSLDALAARDPYFRASDWDPQTASGLMVPTLVDTIRQIISTNTSNFHLRSLLLEAITGTNLVPDLAPVLEQTLLSNERSYSERSAALQALSPCRDKNWFRNAIELLRNQVDFDALRIARSVMKMICFDISDGLFVSCIFSELGVTICALPRDAKRRRRSVRYYLEMVNDLNANRIPSILDIITEYISLVSPHQYDILSEIVKLVEALIVRGLRETVITASDSPSIWRWLAIMQAAGAIYQNDAVDIKAHLEDDHALRQTIQAHALESLLGELDMASAERQLHERLVGLTRNDIVLQLEKLGKSNNGGDDLRSRWKDLVALGRSGFVIDAAVREASRLFQRDDQDLEKFAVNLETPTVPEWKVEQERLFAKRASERALRFENSRRDLEARRTDLRAGEFQVTINPAQAYLGASLDFDGIEPPEARLVNWLGPELRDDAFVGFEAALHRTDVPSAAKVAEGLASHTVYRYSYIILAGLLLRYREKKGFIDIAPDILAHGLLLCYDGALTSGPDLESFQRCLEEIVIPTDLDLERFARLWVEPSLNAGRPQSSGLYKIANFKPWTSVGARLATEWLTSWPNLSPDVELQLVDCLLKSGSLAALVSISAARSTTVFLNFEHMLSWLAVDVLVRFDVVQQELADIGAYLPEFIWYLRNRFQMGRRGQLHPTSVNQAKWIISSFRTTWPYASPPESSSGDTNPYDATDFIRVLLGRLSDDTSVDASIALNALILEPNDSYSDLIRHMAAEQRQKRAEKEFAPLLPSDLLALLADGPPSNIDDLRTLVLEQMTVAQGKLGGDDLDQVRDFWSDTGTPYDENRCRDRLAAMIEPELARYEVQRLTEADMPQTKRADLAFARAQLQLPMEVKGQWHPQVWDAASNQLDAKYLIDWRSKQRGIYCVLWFGEMPSASGRRLKAPPEGVPTPASAEEMRRLLVERIPDTRRAFIDVVVIDLEAGKKFIAGSGGLGAP